LTKTARKFKIVGIEDEWNHTCCAPPAPHVQDEIVTLVSGKFPLTDYRDTSNYAKHQYVFEKTDGSQFTATLEGFTYDCTYEGIVYDIGVPNIWVYLNPTD
jgi:hypothetical protein